MQVRVEAGWSAQDGLPSNWGYQLAATGSAVKPDKSDKTEAPRVLLAKAAFRSRENIKK